MAVNGTVLQPNRRSEGQSYYLSPGADTLIRKRSLVQVQVAPPPISPGQARYRRGRSM
jgi:hypothetical protein